MTPNPLARAGGPKPATHLVRDLSRGVNISTGREAIRDNEAWWMEGLIPLAPGNLKVVDGPASYATSITGETGAPSYVMQFNVNGIDKLFVVWANSGNGWVGTPGTGFTKIFAGTLASGQTAAAQWNKLGILIIDSSAGYFDYGVTTPGAVTALSNSVQSITITDAGTGYTAAPTATVTGPGAGATAAAYIGIGSVVITAGGAGYVVGDVINIPFALPGTELTTVTVTTIGGGGAITGVSITTRGKGITTLAAPIAGTGGQGAGATFTPNYIVTAIVVLTRGSGYTAAGVTLAAGGPPVRQGSATASVSGSLTGTTIAVYAGRSWIGNGRTVTFTDAGQYASFVGSGSQFTIDDSYLHQNITVLYAANNYLYIFGDTSIDVLSNVTITPAGTASFSRVNVTPSIGTSQPQSVFGYYRSIAFANSSGFYLLSGASPEKISQPLDMLYSSILFAFPIYGCQVTVNNVLCACFLFRFTDTFTQSNTATDMMALYFDGKWWFNRPSLDGSALLTMRAMAAIPQNVSSAQGTFVAWTFGTDPTAINQHFFISNKRKWRVMSKLYDLGTPLTSKQAVRAGFGVTMISGGGGLGNWSPSIDTELGVGTPLQFAAGTYSGYQSFIGPAVSTQDNAKYVGFTQTGSDASGNAAQIDHLQWMAMQIVETNEWQ